MYFLRALPTAMPCVKINMATLDKMRGVAKKSGFIHDVLLLPLLLWEEDVVNFGANLVSNKAKIPAPPAPMARNEAISVVIVMVVVMFLSAVGVE